MLVYCCCYLFWI